ncbi:MAG: DUF4388 domain-containing protein [Candidatus Krumholzibacteriota bacterium]|nr:DUF4388 domain-containing protein [Candidatus Krumholzibacteriota bacterium]
MDFSGDLGVLEPAILFQIVNMAGLTGKLKLVATDNLASFYFRGGDLAYATIDTRRRKIGDVLVEQGLITRKVLDETLASNRGRTGNRIGNVLIEAGYLEYEALATAIQEQIKEVVYTVLPWTVGQFAYFNLVEPEDEDILLDIKMDHLILEGLKRLDESRNRRER